MRGFFLVHIRSRVEMDQETYAGNDQQEQNRKLIDLEGKRYVKLPHADKVEEGHHRRFETRLPHLPEDQQTDYKRQKNRPAADDAGQRLRKTIPE